jgi:hypothetical protein
MMRPSPKRAVRSWTRSVHCEEPPYAVEHISTSQPPRVTRASQSVISAERPAVKTRGGVSRVVSSCHPSDMVFEIVETHYRSPIDSIVLTPLHWVTIRYSPRRAGVGGRPAELLQVRVKLRDVRRRGALRVGGGRAPEVRSRCHFRDRGTEHVSDPGVKRMNGGANRQCD